MVEFLFLPEERKKLFIDQVNADTGMTVKAVEKDWWVTLVLKALFSLPIAEHFVFKGGTSLSKGWGLIERLSEDIDIALSPAVFGKEYKAKPTHSYVKQLKREGTAYSSVELCALLQARLLQMGIPEEMFAISVELVKPDMPDKDPQAIFVHYPSLYAPNDYIPDNVKIEFGVRALKEPFEDVLITSEIGKRIKVASYTEEPFSVRAVVPEKTLIEKLLLLHEKFSQPEEDITIAERQSRHLSDIVRLKRKDIHKGILEDPALFDALVSHRRHYIRLKGVDYDLMTLATLSFVPPPQAEQKFRDDYQAMQSEMIYGEAPVFDELMDELRELNALFVLRGRPHTLSQILQAATAEPPGEGDEMDVFFLIDPVIGKTEENIGALYRVSYTGPPEARRFAAIRVLK